jgi:hypothetical protein
MTTPPRILELIERFQSDSKVYTSTAYNETQTRQEFIDLLAE